MTAIGEQEGINETPSINTGNDYGLSAGQNLPNHSTSLSGRGKFIRQVVNSLPEFRDRQAAYRFAAYLVTMAEFHLPDDDGCEGQDFEAILNAVRNA